MDAFVTGEFRNRLFISQEKWAFIFLQRTPCDRALWHKALGEWFAQTHHFDVTFVDIDNPACLLLILCYLSN